jgi:flagellar FliL protein
MSDTKANAAGAAKKSGKGFLPLAAGFALAAVLGGGGWFWFRSKPAAQAAPAAATPSGVKSLMHLESFVINLDGSDDSGYLRVGIDLGLEGELKEGADSKTYEAQVRDTILQVLGNQSVDALLTPDGKTKLKDELLKAIQDKVPEIHCHEIYFTEFLVQR